MSYETHRSNWEQASADAQRWYGLEGLRSGTCPLQRPPSDFRNRRGTSVRACSEGLLLVRQLTLAQDIDSNKMNWDVGCVCFRRLSRYMRHEHGAAVPSCRRFNMCRHLDYVLV